MIHVGKKCLSVLLSATLIAGMMPGMFPKIYAAERELTEIIAEKEVTTYNVGDILDLDDLTVTAYYSDGSEEEVEDYTTNEEEIDMETAGEQDLIIDYSEGDIEVSDFITITIESDEENDSEQEDVTEDGSEEVVYLEDLYAEKETVYYETGDELDVDDITVTAYYSDGTEEEVYDYELNDDEIDMDEAGTQTLIVTYTEDEITLTAEIEIEIEEYVYLEEIQAKKTKTNYFVGEKIKINDLKITAYYSDGSKETIDYDEVETNVSKINTSKAGKKTLEITYEEDDTEASCEIKLNIKELSVPTGIKVLAKGNKINVSYKKVNGAAGYAITYSTSKKFKKSKTVYTKSLKTTISKLKKGTYYVKVSAYHLNGKKKVLAKASAAKKVTIVK